jgi:hypothetical protein
VIAELYGKKMLIFFPPCGTWVWIDVKFSKNPSFKVAVWFCTPPAGHGFQLLYTLTRVELLVYWILAFFVSSVLRDGA